MRARQTDWVVLVAAVWIVIFCLAASPSFAQSKQGTSGEPRKPEEGPVVNMATGSAAPQSISDAGGFKMASDPSSQAGPGGGGALVGPHWGVVSDPQLEAERRIKKLIQRLG